MTTADSLSDTVDGKWLTHAELAEARGISKASAARLVRRTKWRRQADNHGRVRILVPFDAISEAENRPDDRKDDLVEVADGRTDIARVASAFETAIGALRERAEVAEQRADAADARARVAMTMLQKASETLRAEQVARVAMEAEAANLRQALDQARLEGYEAAKAAEEAEEADRRAAAEASEAEQALQAVEAEAAHLREMVEQARGDAQRATQEAEALRQAAEAARVEAPADRSLMVASRIDEVQFRRLQEAEAARRTLGLVARLKAAWRGE